MEKKYIKFINLIATIFMLLVVAVIAVVTLTSCGNMSIGPGNYSFKKVHINTHENACCVEIEKWYDDERGIEVKAKDGGAMYLSEGSYILIEDKCPICDR